MPNFHLSEVPFFKFSDTNPPLMKKPENTENNFFKNILRILFLIQNYMTHIRNSKKVQITVSYCKANS